MLLMRFPPDSAVRFSLLFFLLHSSFLIGEAQAQAPKPYSSSEILLGLRKLNVLGSVLYIAAHPDDENTRLLAYLANERLLDTGYLSCTRGDGGQNLIGPELREALGVIRTQELLAARRIDGAKQFFTRANDFGFSKTPEETFTLWDREQVLADMVWVIRQRRPDVLLTRFPPDARAGHGHHTASALLAIDAFTAAGDPKRFPEQLQHVQPWQPKRLLWNTGSFFLKPGDDLSKFLKLDAGGYNPLLGQSYGEIAARSRSQHRSQGMGSAAQRGEALEYFAPLRAADTVPKDLFEGVDVTWNRVPGGAAVGKLIEEVIRKYDAGNPAASVAGLRKVSGRLHRLYMSGIISGYQGETAKGNYFWFGEKQNEISALMRACLGLHIEVNSPTPTIVAGADLPFNYEIINRASYPFKLHSIHLPNVSGFNEGDPFPVDVLQECVLNVGKKVVGEIIEPVSSKYTLSQPYWLQQPFSNGMYTVPEQHMRGVASNEDYLFRVNAEVIIKYADYKHGDFPRLSGLHIPVHYKHTDPVLGELYQPLAVVPPVMVNLAPGRAYVFADDQPRTVPVTLKAGQAGVSGSLALTLPAGWQCEPAAAPFTLAAKDAELIVAFQVRPVAGAAPGRAELRATATVAGQAYGRGLQVIAYPHIPTQFLFPEAVAPLVKLNVSRGKTQTVGYLMGTGDEVPEALRQLGYTVTLLDATDLTAEKLRRFDAVVLGIRAYNTVEKLKTQQPELLKYVEAGGNLVVQYTVNRGTVIPEIGPYPLKLSADRVSVETAEVTFLRPQHPLLNTPNKLTAQDFQGWVQEQGLYYPSQWDPKYQPIISSHDPGEPVRESAILVADYGKGHYLYTGLSLFRELPAGVPGAYRLLANMISYGK